MRSSVYMNTLNPGDLFYANVVIDKADLTAHPGSSTARNINEGKPVPRICLVLYTDRSTTMQVTYVATHGYKAVLPPELDRTMWYPISPAPLENYDLPPLPPTNGTPQWVSLRYTHTISITWDPVEKRDESLLPSAVAAIRSKMRG
ncbi:hypothetical protein EDD15DRAFT_2238048 [Pisolithus albus]|nr:hypothetical protein EDD15DRAFT_2238048 [Pisolithus albus]